jgi:hypothetical protein
MQSTSPPLLKTCCPFLVAQVQTRLHELEAADQLKGAGVVAILAATGDGPARVHLELQVSGH